MWYREGGHPMGPARRGGRWRGFGGGVGGGWDEKDGDPSVSEDEEVVSEYDCLWRRYWGGGKIKRGKYIRRMLDLRLPYVTVMLEWDYICRYASHHPAKPRDLQKSRVDGVALATASSELKLALAHQGASQTPTWTLNIDLQVVSICRTTTQASTYSFITMTCNQRQSGAGTTPKSTTYSHPQKHEPELALSSSSFELPSCSDLNPTATTTLHQREPPHPP